MRIAVLGAGPVGSTIARAWQRAGHDVSVGVREPEADRHAGVRAGLHLTDVSQALNGAEAVLIATPGTAVPDLVTQHGGAMDGRLVIDATNRTGRTVLHQVPLLTHRLPSAMIYRAFCSVGYEVFADPVVGGEQADLLFIGPDGPERAVVEGLIGDVGLRPIWIGGVEAADTLDGAARLWFGLVQERGLGRRVALKVLSDVPVT